MKSGKAGFMDEDQGVHALGREEDYGSQSKDCENHDG
jgi:hypothetical protein